MVGPVEADPEYQLIVDSNNLTVEIDNEISKQCCFPEIMMHIIILYDVVVPKMFVRRAVIHFC